MIEEHYIQLLNLEKLKKVRSNDYNFRCPLCGDSKKSKIKTRGHIYNFKGDWFYHCFNCEYVNSFSGFLKDNHPEKFQQYKFEKFRSGEWNLKSERQKKPDEIDFSFKEEDFHEEDVKKYESLVSVTDLEESHKAVQYLIARKIPREKWKNVFFSENYKKTVCELSGDDSHRIYPDERICFLLEDVNKIPYGIIGRSLESNPILRYNNFKWKEYPKLYNLNSVDKQSTIYITEGIFDSLFLDNSISICQGDFVSSATTSLNKKLSLVVVPDNEPRHPHTIKKTLKAIENGFKVCIWSEMNSNYKDINEMILSGYSKESVKNFIDSHTYVGNLAKLKLTQWKKI